MLPDYTPKRQKPTRWTRFKWWLEDLVPYAINIGFVAAICLLLWWLIPRFPRYPRCPKCDRTVHPMDVYCSECGQQLRITKNNELWK